MATFEAHIEGLTQIDITTSSAPTQDELTEFLQEGLVDVVNKMIQYKPQEAFKFAAESEAADDNGITVTGTILSVLREQDGVDVLRPCTPIPAEHKYEATNVKSLYYRSKTNPGYFVSNGKIFVRPAAAGSNNDMKVSQISYDIGSGGLAFGDNYNQGAVANFPTEYEYLIATYAAAKSCQAAASNIQNNMPTAPTAPISPDFSDQDVNLPDLPSFIQPALNLNSYLSNIQSAIAREDFDLVDKQVSLFDKHMEKYSKNYDSENTTYQKELEIFKADLERLAKNADRKIQVDAVEYKNQLDRYAGETRQYTADMQEEITKYKWYVDQSLFLMGEYYKAFGIQPQKKKEQPKKEKKKEGDR
jgi:hypothetical protein